MRRHHHKYWPQEQLGAQALSEAECPYRVSQIGKRCAWLAGYRDKHRRFAA
jgi:ribosome modulation factor